MLKLYLAKGWQKVSQRGSHVKVKNKKGESTIIPMHKELKKGTEQSLLKRLEES